MQVFGSRFLLWDRISVFWLAGGNGNSVFDFSGSGIVLRFSTLHARNFSDFAESLWRSQQYASSCKPLAGAGSGEFDEMPVGDSHPRMSGRGSSTPSSSAPPN